MKKIFRFAAIVAAAAALFSCQEKPTPEPGTGDEPGTENKELNVDIKFTLTVTEVETDQAKIKVEHDGERTDTWYGFLTTESDIDQAIDEKVADLVASGKISLQKSTSKTITERGLEPETAYTYVVFGLSEEGQVYGEPVSTEFTTAAETPVNPEPPVGGEFTENPAWTVTYIGDYEQDGKVYEHVVMVETTDTNPYFVTAWPVELYEEYGIEAITAAEIDYWNELIAQYPGATFADVVYTESILSTVEIDPEYGTKWYAMAIGCDTNGNATGLYALSSVIDLENTDNPGGGDGGEDVELTPEYADWIGDWTFTGANGVSWPITFSKGKANESYIMTGWEEQTDLPLEVLWDAENGIWAAMIQPLGTYDFDGGQTGDIWFVAFAGNNFYTAEGIPAFLGGYDGDGNRIAIGYEPQDDKGNTIVFDKAGYVASIGGKWYTFTGVTDFPTYPITITPATKARACSFEEFKGGKKSFNPLAPRTFKTYSIDGMSFKTL